MSTKTWIENAKLLLGVAVLVGFLVFFTYSWIHTLATCDGHVVKNWMDWPVCVR